MKMNLTIFIFFFTSLCSIPIYQSFLIRHTEQISNITQNFAQADIETFGTDIEKVISCGNFILGIHSQDRTLKAFIYQTSGFKKIEISEMINDQSGIELMNRSIKNILIDSNIGRSFRKIMVIDEMEMMTVLKVNQFTLEKMLVDFRVDVHVIKKYDMTNFVEINGIYYVAVANSGYGLAKISKDGVHEIISDFSWNGKQVSLNIIDIQEVGSAVYAIVQSYGLVIIKAENESKEISITGSNILHPCMNNFFTTKSKRLAILLSCKSIHGFFELNITDEYSPFVISDYLISTPFDFKSSINDDKYYYVLDNDSQSIIIFPVILNSSVYSLSINDYWNHDEACSLFVFFDQSFKKAYIGFHSNGKISYIKSLHVKNEIAIARYSSQSAQVFEVFVLIFIILIVLALVLAIFKFNRIKKWWQRRQNLQRYYDNPEEDNQYDQSGGGQSGAEGQKGHKPVMNIQMISKP